MIIKHSLKFPEGEFTHTELARFNGVSNQTAWNQYLDARKTGRIVSAGTRKTPQSKGVPSLLWRVNPNFTMALMTVPQPVRTVAERAAVANTIVGLASVLVEHDELRAELAAELASA